MLTTALGRRHGAGRVRLDDGCIDGYLYINPMARLDPAGFNRIAKALADPQRCEILERTAAGAFCCSALVEIFPLTQATVSHHLKELTEAGLLGRRKRGQLAYYFFRPETMEAYVDELSRRMRLRGSPESAPSIPPRAHTESLPRPARAARAPGARPARRTRTDFPL